MKIVEWLNPCKLIKKDVFEVIKENMLLYRDVFRGKDIPHLSIIEIDHQQIDNDPVSGEKLFKIWYRLSLIFIPVEFKIHFWSSKIENNLLVNLDLTIEFQKWEINETGLFNFRDCWEQIVLDPKNDKFIYKNKDRPHFYPGSDYILTKCNSHFYTLFKDSKKMDKVFKLGLLKLI